jgi:hypothetical protein
MFPRHSQDEPASWKIKPNIVRIRGFHGSQSWSHSKFSMVRKTCIAFESGVFKGKMAQEFGANLRPEGELRPPE